LERAREYSKRALELLQAANFPAGITWGQYILAQVLLAEGDAKSVFELVQAGRQLASQTGRENIQGAWFAALGAQANLDTGDLSAALRWAESTGFTSQDSPHHWTEWPYFTYIRVLIAQGRFMDARTLLDTMEERARGGARNRKLITIHLLHALCLLEQGQMPQAQDRIERALELAASGDYKRAFLDEGGKIAQHLPKARNAAPAFVDELLHTYQAPIHHPGQRDQLMEPLTEREQEVLELVAKGLSNRQIAEVLYVTIGTVKKHLNNIFGKLYVESRTQAISRGRELDLLK
jgi:LuxR family maltose regulon positive regulatory protein